MIIKENNMEKKKLLAFELTEKQKEILKPLKKEQENAWEKGQKPMVLLQLDVEFKTARGRFIDPETSDKLNKVMYDAGIVHRVIS